MIPSPCLLVEARFSSTKAGRALAGNWPHWRRVARRSTERPRYSSTTREAAGRAAVQVGNRGVDADQMAHLFGKAGIQDRLAQDVLENDLLFQHMQAVADKTQDADVFRHGLQGFVTVTAAQVFDVLPIDRAIMAKDADQRPGEQPAIGEGRRIAEVEAKIAVGHRAGIGLQTVQRSPMGEVSGTLSLRGFSETICAKL